MKPRIHFFNDGFSDKITLGLDFTLTEDEHIVRDIILDLTELYKQLGLDLYNNPKDSILSVNTDWSEATEATLKIEHKIFINSEALKFNQSVDCSSKYYQTQYANHTKVSIESILSKKSLIKLLEAYSFYLQVNHSVIDDFWREF